MTDTGPSRGKWRARMKRKAVVLAAREAHGASVQQTWADSAAKLVHPEAARAGQSRVPESLRAERPDVEMLVEKGASARPWFRQQQRDAAVKGKRVENDARRARRELAAATPKPSRRQQILAARRGDAR